jgi:xylulokinase
MYFIGIDIGTTSVKLLAIDGQGNVVRSATREYPLSFPRALNRRE